MVVKNQANVEGLIGGGAIALSLLPDGGLSTPLLSINLEKMKKGNLDQVFQLFVQPPSLSERFKEGAQNGGLRYVFKLKNGTVTDGIQVLCDYLLSESPTLMEDFSVLESSGKFQGRWIEGSYGQKSFTQVVPNVIKDLAVIEMYSLAEVRNLSDVIAKLKQSGCSLKDEECIGMALFELFSNSEPVHDVFIDHDYAAQVINKLLRVMEVIS